MELEIEGSTYLFVNEAAKLLGVHNETIRRLSRSGKLPYKRNHNGYRVFEKSTLLAFKHWREQLHGGQGIS